MLLSVTSCDVNKTDNDNTTPLIMAALTGNTSVCELLVSNENHIQVTWFGLIQTSNSQRRYNAAQWLLDDRLMLDILISL